MPTSSAPIHVKAKPAPKRRRVPPSRSPVFGPIAPGDAPLTRARTQAHRRTQRARRKVEARTTVPYVPQLRHPTPAQRGAAVSIVARGLHKQGIRTAEDVKALPPAQRRRVARATAYATANARYAAIANALAHGAPTALNQQALEQIGRALGRRTLAELRPGHIRHGLGGEVDRLGVSLDQRLFGQSPNLRLASVPYQIARATVEHPTKVIPRTITGFGNLAIGALAAPIELGANTVTGAAHGDPALGVRRLADAAKRDYSRRYGPLLSDNPAAFRRRLVKEGVASEAVDIATVVAPAGAVVGRTAGALARYGTLGSRLQRFAKEPRPHLRVSGGKVVEQDVSPNLIRLAGQRAQDRGRKALAQRRVTKAERSGSGVRGLQPGKGEVVRGTTRAQERSQRNVVAQRGAIGFHRQQREQAREVHKGARQAISKLSKRQRAAVFHVVQGLVTPDNPKLAVRQLRIRRAKILAERERTGRGAAKGTRSTNDEIASIDFLIGHADEVFGGANGARLRAFHEGEVARSKRVEKGDPGVKESTALVRRLRPQGDLLGVTHEFDRRSELVDQAESAGKLTPEQASAARVTLEQQHPALDRQYVAQVRAAAEQAHLPEPVFLSHRPRPTGGHGDFAPGGAKAIAGVQRSRMTLFRHGIADVTPAAYVQSLARTIKRKHNWATVSDQFDAHALRLDPARVGKILGRKGPANVKGLTLHEVRTVIDHLGLDPKDVGFWNPGRLRAAASDHAEQGLAHAEDAYQPTAGLDKAVRRGTADEERLAELSPTEREQFLRTRGWQILPRGAYDEIMASTNPSGVTGRLIDKAQGLQSRVLLGTSPAWLSIQVAANGILSGFGVHGNLPDFAKAQAWWHELPQAQRNAIDDYLGQGVFAAHGHKTHLGASVSDRNHLVNAWRAFSETSVAAAGRRVNPLDLMFRADDAQNKFFKRTVLYSQVKRDAYKRMGESMSRLAVAHEKLTHAMSLGPKDAMLEIVRHPELLEAAAKATNDILGDWSTYTIKERRVFKRGALFYGYFRFSLRMLFYTLPVKHPLVGAAVAKLAQLHNEEVNDLLGGPAVPWAYSRIFFGKDGNLRSIDVGRANPLSNPLVSFAQEGPKALAGLQSPLSQALSDQVYGQNAFTGQRFHVHGSAEDNPNPDAVTRARIFANQLLSLAFPYREAQKATQPGRQGDDTLLFSARPTKYKTADAIARNEQRIARAGKARAMILRDLFPLAFPKPEDAASLLRTKPNSSSKGGAHSGWGVSSGSSSGSSSGAASSGWGVR